MSKTDNNDILLNEIHKLSNIFLDNIKKIDSKIDNILLRVKNLENKIEYIETSKNNPDLKRLKDFKLEDLDIPDENILKALNYKDHRSILNIFKLYYKNNLNPKYSYPIRIKGQYLYEYYLNDEWVPDLYGRSIINILCKNIEKLFIKNNIIENVEPNTLILNQEFIYKLSDDKFKKSILVHIAEEIRISNL
jgi:hypothetical protein